MMGAVARREAALSINPAETEAERHLERRRSARLAQRAADLVAHAGREDVRAALLDALALMDRQVQHPVEQNNPTALIRRAAARAASADRQDVAEALLGALEKLESAE